MNSKELIKNILRIWQFKVVDKREIQDEYHTSESNVRKAIAELMVEEGIVYFPVRTFTGKYARFEGTRSDVRHIESEMRLLTKSMATMYFKRLHTYKKLLKAYAKELQFPTLLEKMEQLELIFGEIAEMEGKQ